MLTSIIISVGLCLLFALLMIVMLWYFSRSAPMYSFAHPSAKTHRLSSASPGKKAALGFEEDDEKIKLPILFVTAHPDDECMFFSPTILSIRRQIDLWMEKRRRNILVPLNPSSTPSGRASRKRRPKGTTGFEGEELEDFSQYNWLSTAAHQMYIICLSSGNHDGLGEDRKMELICSCTQMGFLEERITILDVLEFPDGPEFTWRRSDIVFAIDKHIREFGIQSVISFDGYGVSGHPNHCAIGHTVSLYPHLVSSSSKAPKFIDCYVLESSTLWRKFLGVLDVPITFIAHHVRQKLKQLRYLRHKKTDDDDSASNASSSEQRILFITSPAEYLMGCMAMFHHESQLVWFRWLYIIFSRFMYTNTLVKKTTAKSNQ